MADDEGVPASAAAHLRLLGDTRRRDFNPALGHRGRLQASLPSLLELFHGR